MLIYSFDLLKSIEEYNKKASYLNDFRKNGVIDEPTYAKSNKFLEEKRTKIKPLPTPWHIFVLLLKFERKLLAGLAYRRTSGCCNRWKQIVQTFPHGRVEKPILKIIKE